MNAVKIETTSTIEHNVTEMRVCDGAGICEYVFVNADAWLDVTINGRPLTITFQNGHTYKGNNLSCPSNKFIVGTNSNDFMSKLGRLSEDDDEQEQIDEVIELSEGVLTTAEELWALKGWLKDNTPTIDDLGLSDDIDDYEVEVDEFNNKFVIEK